MAAILLLASPGRTGTVIDHVDAFRRWSRHEVFTWDPLVRGDSRFLDLGEFDAVVLHYSLLVTNEAHVPPRLRDALRSFRGLKVQYVQDDYRQVDRIAAAMRDIGVGLLFCLVPEEQIPQVWSDERLPGVVKRSTLAGFVPEALVGRVVAPPERRPVDVGYRGRDLPPWLGRLAGEKVRIGRQFLARSARMGLRCDIAWREADRLYGERWIRFVASCRTVLGTESAVSIVDFDGTVEERARAYLAAHPGAGDDDVHRDVLSAYEGNVVLRVVSPRVFEAAALRTGLVLFPGRYSGVVEPWRHYVPLAEDFSNIDEVVRHVRDDAFIREMTDRVESDLVASGRYSLRSMVGTFDDAVAERLGSARPRAKVAFALACLGTSEPVRETRAAGRSLGHDLLRVRNATLLAVLGAWAAAANPVVWRLAHHRLSHRGPGAPSWSRVGADLARLALLRRRVQRPSGAERMRTGIRPGGGLWVETVPTGAPGAGVALAPADGPEASLTWDCRATGGAIRWRGPAGIRLTLPVGVGGLHVFETASWFAATAADPWRAAVAPLLGPLEARP
jgi:hypothetical protein